MQQRDSLKQNLFKIVQGVIDFVQNGRFGLMQLVGAPPEQNLLRQLFSQHLGLQRVRLLCPVQLAEQVGEGPLLFADGVADDLGGVGGEHQADVQPLQQPAQQSRRHPLKPQVREQTFKFFVFPHGALLAVHHAHI